jgi:hypothetical protein
MGPRKKGARTAKCTFKFKRLVFEESFTDVRLQFDEAITDGQTDLNSFQVLLADH